MIEGTALPDTVNPRGPLLHAVVAAAVFLGIQAAAMYWLGQRSRRRTSSGMGAIVVRAGLWSLILSWRRGRPVSVLARRMTLAAPSSAKLPPINPHRGGPCG